MKKLLKTLITAYIVIKVAPPVIRGVAYITEGAVRGVSTKIVKDIFNVIDRDEKDQRRTLGSTTYTRYTSNSKGKA